MARHILIFLAILACVYTQCTIPKAKSFFRRSIYDFTVKLAGRISLDTESHFIASGVSPWILLSTISLGATEETLTEIAHVLRMHPHPCFNEKYNLITKQLTTTTNGAILERSSTIFVDNNVKVMDDFVFDVKKAGVCDIEELPFEDSVSTTQHINERVSLATHEAIDEIVTTADIEGASILILDALYFKGYWKIQFPYSDTELSAFYNDRGNQIGDVDLMFVNGIFNITGVKQLQARVLELPYGEENKFSMLIFLPYIDVTINSVIENLDRISLRTIFALYERRGPANVAVQIPKFTLSSDINNLKELLMDMGLRQMFDRYEAKFQALTNTTNVYVSNLIQKVDIEVTEDGTVASAVSEAEFEARMLPDQFMANKPFLFMIVERDLEIPLFIGAYSVPPKPNSRY